MRPRARARFRWRQHCIIIEPQRDLTSLRNSMLPPRPEEDATRSSVQKIV